MTIWSSDVLNHHDGLSKGAAATGVTAIVTGMTIGRLSSARLALRYSADTLLLFAFGVNIVGFGVFWMSTNPVVAFVGLFIAGLGISLQFPLAITRAVRFSDGRPDLATAYAALGGGFAIAVAPFGLGALADHVGSHTAMTVVPLFVLLAAAGVATTRRPARCSHRCRRANRYRSRSATSLSDLRFDATATSGNAARARACRRQRRRPRWRPRPTPATDRARRTSTGGPTTRPMTRRATC